MQEPEEFSIETAITDMVEKVNGIGEKVSDIEDRVEKAEKAQYPYGVPGSRVHGVRTGEDPLSSRPFSLMRLNIALQKRASNQPGWNDNAKLELSLSERLQKEYSSCGQVFDSGELVPLGADLMPTSDIETEEGKVLPGIKK